MGGHVLIVDRDPGRRAALLAGLALPEGEAIESDTPEDLPIHAAQHRPDLLLLDLGEPAEPALEALRWIRRRPGGPLPAIALVPPERPDLRCRPSMRGPRTRPNGTPRCASSRLVSAASCASATLPSTWPRARRPRLPSPA